jgi:hypothetical protein
MVLFAQLALFLKTLRALQDHLLWNVKIPIQVGVDVQLVINH